jgi:hypothetical protein
MDPKLITTLAEVQAQVPVNMTSDFDTIKPFLRTAETTWVQRLIGTDQYDALVALYQPSADPAPNDTQAAALDHCRRIIANIGYYYAVPVLSVSIGTSGITVTSNDQTKQAFQWQVEELKDALQDLGFRGIEDLLALLESDPESFAGYAASDELAAQKSMLIQSAADFNQYYEIGVSRLVFNSIAYLVRRIEQQNLTQLFGPEVLATVKASGADSPHQTLLNTYIKPGVAMIAVAKALIERVITLEQGKVAFNFKGRDNNMSQSQPGTTEQIADMAGQLTADGQNFLQNGLAYVTKNATSFPEYVAPEPRSRFQITNKRRGVAGF